MAEFKKVFKGFDPSEVTAYVEKTDAQLKKYREELSVAKERAAQYDALEKKVTALKQMLDALKTEFEAESRDDKKALVLIEEAQVLLGNDKKQQDFEQNETLLQTAKTEDLPTETEAQKAVDASEEEVASKPLIDLDEVYSTDSTLEELCKEMGLMK